MLALQQGAGNRGVGQLLERRGAGTPGSMLIQRQAPPAPPARPAAGAPAAAPPLDARLIADRITTAIGVWETNRGGAQPRPIPSGLETVAGVRASVVSVGQQIVSRLVTVLRANANLRNLVNPPLTVAELNQADTRMRNVNSLLRAVSRAGRQTPDQFIAAQAQLIASTGLTADEVRRMFSFSRDLEPRIRATTELRAALERGAATPVEDFLRANAALIGRSRVPEATVRTLHAGYARQARVRALLAAIDRARQGRRSAEDVLRDNADAVAGAGVTEEQVRRFLRSPREQERFRQRVDAQFSPLRQLAEAIPANERLGVGVGSLMGYIRAPGNLGENEAAWQRVGVERLPNRIGQRIVEAGEHRGGVDATSVDVLARVQRLVQQRPQPGLEAIVRTVARSWNRHPAYPTNVWNTYRRLFPDQRGAAGANPAGAAPANPQPAPAAP